MLESPTTSPMLTGLHLGLPALLAADGPAAHLLPRGTWVAGGCVVLARALSGWSRGLLQAGAVIAHPGGRAVFVHAFVWTDHQSSRLLIDAHGVHAEPALRAVLEGYDRMPRPFEVRYQPCADLVAGLWRDPQAVRQLRALLADRFGAFSGQLS